MNMNKRYIQTVSFYIWADSDEKAIMKAKKITNKMDKKFNIPILLEVESAPFGSLINKTIYKK